MAQVKTQDEEAGLAEQIDLKLDADIDPFTGRRTAAAERAGWLRDELDLIPSPEFAKALGLEEQTLANWRTEKQGPDFVKLGKTVFYRRELIKEWIGRSVTVLATPAPQLKAA